MQIISKEIGLMVSLLALLSNVRVKISLKSTAFI